MTGTTQDSISLRKAGVVTVTQPRIGSRFTQDSLLLADFCRLRPRDRVLEPGAGTGVVSLLLAKKHPSVAITAIEVQPRLAALCKKNAQDNALGHRIDVLERDLSQHGLSPISFNAIAANPPYTRRGAGRRSPSLERQGSRHDDLACLSSWLDLAALLKDRGRYFVIFPAARLAELAAALVSRKLEPKRLRFIHSSLDCPASLVLIGG